MNVARKNKIAREHCLVACAFSVLVFLAFVYMYLLSSTVAHVVIQKEINFEKNSLYSEISMLESEYITKQHSLSSGFASLDGFVEAGDKIFIDKTDASLVLVLGDNSL